MQSPLQNLSYVGIPVLARELGVSTDIIRRVLRNHPEVEVLRPGTTEYLISVGDFMTVWRASRVSFGTSGLRSGLRKWHAEQRARKEQLQAAV